MNGLHERVELLYTTTMSGSTVSRRLSLPPQHGLGERYFVLARGVECLSQHLRVSDRGLVLGSFVLGRARFNGKIDGSCCLPLKSPSIANKYAGNVPVTTHLVDG